MLMLQWLAEQLKQVWSNTDETVDTNHWTSVVRMPASNMFDTRLSKRTKHRPSNTRTKEMFYVFDRKFDGLQILSNTIKQYQTRCPNGEIVWWPNNVWCCLVAKHFPFGQALRATDTGVLLVKAPFWFVQFFRYNDARDRNRKCCRCA